MASLTAHATIHGCIAADATYQSRKKNTSIQYESLVTQDRIVELFHYSKEHLLILLYIISVR